MEKISRTKKKRAAEELQRIGEQLSDLDAAQLGRLELPLDLEEALAALRTFKSHGARRRQLQYIGRLMRGYDSDVLQQALQKMAAKQDRSRRHFKLVECWRDDLVAGDDGRLDWLLASFPAIDQQQLRLLVNNSRGVATQMTAKEASRKLFRFLSRLEDETEPDKP